MAYDWKSLIPFGIQGGLGYLGQRMANGPIREQNEWSRRQYEQQLGRRNQQQAMVLPSMLRALGYRDPQQIQQMIGQANSSSGGGNMATGNAVPSSVPGTQGSTGSKILGGASAGLGVAGALGLGAAGPIGLAAGLGSLAVGQIGKGRRTANPFVDSVENPLGHKLAQISVGQGGPEELKQAVQEYRQQVQGWLGQGGNHAKVAQQSLNNQQLQETIQRLAQQLGVQV